MGTGNITTPNTTYSNATTSTAGLMSTSDKSKLDGIAANANNYSLPAATSSVLGGVKTGSNITNSSGTISLTKANVTSALGYTPPTTNTTYTTATTSANGLMSSTDKAKLDGIAAGATKITVDSALSSSSTNPVQNKIINTALNAKQATLVSGTNIKTINGNSILGSGNLVVESASKPVVYTNITVDVTPTALSTYCDWDTEQKYGYSATVTISGLTTNSLIQNLVMTDTLLEAVACIVTTTTNGLIFYTEDATPLSGTIYTLVVSEVS